MLKFPKVELRTPTLEEIKVFADMEKDKDVGAWLGADASLEWHMDKLYDPNIHHLAVVRNESAVGYITIIPHENGKIVELARGMTLPQFRGKYGVSWFISSVSYAFTKFNAKVVWCDVKKHNTRAIKIYKRVGFQEVAAPPGKVSADVASLLVFALTKNRWLELNSPTNSECCL